MTARAKHLFTDCACIRQRGIATWAGMLIDNLDSELRAGIIGVALKDATAAEFHAVRYALRSFLRDGTIERGDTIIVHCDNLDVCRHLHDERLRLPRSPQQRSQIEIIRRTARTFRLAICAEWIKAHQGREATCWRSLINQRVDHEARNLSKAENKRRIGRGDTGRLPAYQQIAAE